MPRRSLPGHIAASQASALARGMRRSAAVDLERGGLLRGHRRPREGLRTADPRACSSASCTSLTARRSPMSSSMPTGARSIAARWSRASRCVGRVRRARRRRAQGGERAQAQDGRHRALRAAPSRSTPTSTTARTTWPRRTAAKRPTRSSPPPCARPAGSASDAWCCARASSSWRWSKPTRCCACTPCASRTSWSTPARSTTRRCAQARRAAAQDGRPARRRLSGKFQPGRYRDTYRDRVSTWSSARPRARRSIRSARRRPSPPTTSWPRSRRA